MFKIFFSADKPVFCFSFFFLFFFFLKRHSWKQERNIYTPALGSKKKWAVGGDFKINMELIFYPHLSASLDSGIDYSSIS